jgi:hypothetical protein
MTPTKERKRLWECPKCHEHFYQYVIDDYTPVCDLKVKDCPAKQASSQLKARAALAPERK